MAKPTFLEDVDRYPDEFYVIHSGIEKSFPIHSHRKHQIYYLEGGIAFFNTPTASYFVPAQHFLWIPAGMEHYITFRTTVKMVHNIYIPSSLPINNDELWQKAGIYPVSNLLYEMIYFTLEWDGGINVKDENRYQFLLTLKNVVSKMATSPLPIALPTSNNEDIRPILQFVQDHINQNLSLENVASEFGYSTRTLSRIFRKNLQTSFLQYVKLSRVIRAMELMLQTNFSISEVAFLCGYANLSSFSYAFQKMVNMSPASFKKKTQDIQF